jgi:uncharacterized cupredoxin-like copper-binding protein
MFVPSAALGRRGLSAALALAALILLLAGCGPANRVGIQFSGYTIQPSTATVRAGDVVFNITNQNGQVLHQLLVVQSDVPAGQFHPGPDSMVDESGLKIVARVDNVDLGQSATATAHLAPGHYVLLCNIVGHYQLGMHTDFTVTP